MVMICKVKIAHFQEWNRSLLLGSAAHKAAGLTLLNIWRPQEDLESVFFIFAVRDVDAAKSYLDEPLIAENLGLPNLDDTEFRFAETADGY